MYQKRKLYNYIKNRTLKNIFNKYYHNTKIENNINKNECYLYNYIKNRTLNKVFQNYYWNENYEKKCNEIKEQLPEYLKIKNLIRRKEIDKLLEKLNLEDISTEINNISKKEINKNYLTELIKERLKEIELIINAINPSNHFKNNQKKGLSGLFEKLFGNNNENKNSLNEFIVYFNVKKVLLDHKLSGLEVIEEKLDKEIKISIKNLEKLEKIQNILNQKLKIVKNIEKYMVNDNNAYFDLKNKEQTVLELMNILNMTIQSLNINIKNLYSYKEIFNKIKIITRNTLNLGVMLFVNSKVKTFNELVTVKNDEFTKYISKLEEVKELSEKI